METIKNDFGKKPQLSTLAYGRIPPQAPDLEEAVIGACMLERESFEEVVAVLPNEDCFYVDAHQKIFKAMKALFVSGRAVDLLTITEELRKNNDLELVGGAYYLTRLTMTVLSSAHVVDHSRIIMEKHIQRELIRSCGEILNAAYEDSTDVFELMDDLHSKYNKITELVTGGTDNTVGNIYKQVVENIDSQRKNHSALTGIDTGFVELNEMTSGWQDSDLIIIGARPSKGKTALGLNLALNASISEIVNKRAVGIFSLEMASAQLLQRMTSTVTKIPFDNIRTGKVSDEEFDTLGRYSTYFSQLPIRIDDKTLSILQICARARKWKKKFNIGMIVIDYLQLIKGERTKNGNREQEIASITRDLKQLAKELSIPVILLAQLNRDVEKRTPPEPMLSDLRESGAIEQDADIVLFPWHEVEAVGGDYRNWISIAKNRNGKTGKIEVKFLGGIQKWVNKEDMFDQFKDMEDMRRRDNPQSGIRQHFQPSQNPDIIDEEAPF